MLDHGRCREPDATGRGTGQARNRQTIRAGATGDSREDCADAAAGDNRGSFIRKQNLWQAALALKNTKADKGGKKATPRQCPPQILRSSLPNAVGDPGRSAAVLGQGHQV